MNLPIYCECEELVKLLEETTNKEVKLELINLIFNNYEYEYDYDIFNNFFCFIVKIYDIDDYGFKYDYIEYIYDGNHEYDTDLSNTISYRDYYEPTYDNTCKLHFIECLDHYSCYFIDTKLYELIKDKPYYFRKN